MISTIDLLLVAVESANRDGMSKLSDDIQAVIARNNTTTVTQKPCEDETPPFDPPYSPPFDQQYMLQSGKYRGRFLNELGTPELQGIWHGFNGCGYIAVADQIKAEIDRRIALR